MTHPLKVAVIGAGVSGLIAARELHREGHDVIIFEKNNRVGGTWVYNPNTDSDPLGIDPTREKVHSSVYLSLRTNIPRQTMGFSDYPFKKRESGDPRTFPGHEEVLHFLEEFAGEFGIHGLTRYETEVLKVEKRKKEWVVKSRGTRGCEDSVSCEVFDAVVVCSGHFVEPKLGGDVPGIDTWRGFQMHSHNYRVPHPFKNQTVIIIGLGPSSFDISRDIARVAKEVHVATWLNPDLSGIKLENVRNIYFHTLGVIFNVAELQAKWVARVLSGKVQLPTEEEMVESIKEFYQFMEENGLPKRYTHCLHPFQVDYKHWLAAQIGLPPLEDWRDNMLKECLKNVVTMNEMYRDEWDDNHWDAFIQNGSAS